jgi:hypothetical protein
MKSDLVSDETDLDYFSDSDNLIWLPGSPVMKSVLVDIEGEVVGQTDLAYRFDNGDDLVWLPKSECEWDAGTQTMTMPEWLAFDKGLI